MSSTLGAMLTVNVLKLDVPAGSHRPLRQLPHQMNSPLEVYISSVKCLRHSLTSPYFRLLTTENLSDEVLLNIFRYYLDASPRYLPPDSLFLVPKPKTKSKSPSKPVAVYGLRNLKR